MTADNRTAFASERGLDYRDGSVLVVVELAPGARLPAAYPVAVDLREGLLVQGQVAVDDLVGLAGHANVTAVRPPTEPRVA